MRPVRVLIVAPSLSILGGQAVQARALLDGLATSPSLQVGFLAVNPALPGLLGVLQRIKYLRTVVTSIAYVLALLRQVPRYDVVHAFSASYWSFLLAPLPALLVARLLGSKAVLNYHSGEAADHLEHWPVSAWLIRRLPHKLVVPSGYLVEVFGRFGLRAMAICNHVPIERLPYRCRDRLEPKILSNRNLEPMYNVQAVLHAFAIVQAEVPTISLLVAGDGSQRGPLELLAAELGLRNVEFAGRVPNDRVGELYERCDLFVNASLIDNMPLSIIEAFACGLPVVTSDAGGIPQMVKDGITALVVPGSDPSGLAAALLRLLRDPRLAISLATAGRTEAEGLYTWRTVRPQWETLYADLAGELSP
jgi:glycosyltransferase involved in cell wall biosynthesis